MSSDSKPNAGLGRDTNELQRAIRERAQQTINRPERNFWYSSPKRLIVTLALVSALMGLTLFGVDQSMRVFNWLMHVYISSRKNAAPQPESKTPGVIYVLPDEAPPTNATPPSNPTSPSPAP